MNDIRYIEFGNEELSNLIIETLIESYTESGGNDIAIQCINYMNDSIIFDHSNLIESFDVQSIIENMRSNEIDSFEIKKSEHTIYGCSYDGGREWVVGVGVGDNGTFIKGCLENLWYSTFEL